MHQDNIRSDGPEAILDALRGISVGSYVFQSELAERLGLHATDLHAIYRVGLAPGGLTAGQLAKQLRLASGSTTAAIDRLVEAGYVQRERDPADGRRVIVRLRTEGVAKLRGEYRDIDRRIEEAIGKLTAREREVVTRFLAAIAA